MCDRLFGNLRNYEGLFQRCLNAEDYAGACAELLRWRFYKGRDCALPANARLCGGLATRRQSEYHQCIGEAP